MADNFPLSPDKYKELIDRINNYKSTIDLSTYIRETDKDFVKDDQKSTRTNHILRKLDSNGQSEEVISCWKRKDVSGHYMYASKYNERDSGSIVEYVKSRSHETSLIKVDQILSDYVNQPRLSINERVPKADRIAAAPTQPNARNEKVAGLFNLSPLVDRNYIYSRGIDDRTLDSKEFNGRIFNEKVSTAGGANFTNTAFPIFAKTGDIVGVERKNYNYHDPNRAYSRSAFGSEKASGLWASRHSSGEPIDKLMLGEAPIDALSYHKLKHNGTDKMMYMASNGPWTEQQIDIVQSFINTEKPNKIVLAHDNDLQGYKNNIHMAGQICRPQDALEKENGKPLPGSGIYTEDTSIKVRCTNLDKYNVKLSLDVSYANNDEGTKVLNNLQNRFKGLGKDDEGMPKFDGKVLKQGPNNAEMEVIFPNAKMELGQARDLVIDVRKMDNYLEIDRPRNKDWNLDLKEELEKAKNITLTNEPGLKNVKLSSGEDISESMVKSFKNMANDNDISR